MQKDKKKIILIRDKSINRIRQNTKISKLGGWNIKISVNNILKDLVEKVNNFNNRWKILAERQNFKKNVKWKY